MEKKTTIITAAAGLTAAVALAVTGASLANAQAPANAAATGYAGTAPGQEGTGHGPGGPGASNGNTDPTKPMRSDEHLLTGDVAAKVTAAAKAREPNATIQRVETDSDGVYEAHMVRADGTLVTVKVDKTYAVTGVEVGQGMRGQGNRPTQSATPSATT